MNFGLTIYNARVRKKMSQREVAERVGINSGTLSRIERGQMMPSFQAAVNLVEALEIPYKSIFPLISREMDPTSNAQRKRYKRSIELIEKVESMSPQQQNLFNRIFALISSERVGHDEKSKY